MMYSYFVRILTTIAFFFFGLPFSYSQFLGGVGSGQSEIGTVNAACAAMGVNPYAGGNADGHSNAILINVVCSAVAVNPYAGGNSDGHSNASLINMACVAVAVNPYAGGNSDGHSNASLINMACVAVAVNPYAGGNSDGHSNASLINRICTAVAVNPYAGGNSDGHSCASLINRVCTAVAVNPYAGGNSDGHSNASLINRVCTAVAVNPYAGGNSDGHSCASLINTICSVIAVNPYAGGVASGQLATWLIRDNTCTQLPLPVELLFFNAKCVTAGQSNKARQVTITWETALQTNNDFFTIERSADGASFQSLSEVDGEGSSSRPINYSFTDAEPLPGTSYYRLKQTDFNGTSQYFNLVAVACGDNNPSAINIYPNPTKGHFFIEGAEFNAQLIILNPLGEKIMNQKISSPKTEIDLSRSSKGIYFIWVNSAKENRTQKLIISQ